MVEAQKHLFDLRTQAVTEKLEDPTQLRKTKRAIARIKTVLRQRELEAAKSGKAAEPAKPDGSEPAKVEPAATPSPAVAE